MQCLCPCLVVSDMPLPATAGDRGVVGAAVAEGIEEGGAAAEIELRPPGDRAGTHHTASGMLGTELSLSLRGRMTLGVGEIFWFISHTLPQCHAL
jgi:hypothetical protein